VIGGVALAVLCVYELARLRNLISAPLTDIDLLGFHLPGVARFIQGGTVWRVDQFLPGFGTAQYPNNGEFLIMATILPWHDLAFARLPGVIFFVLTGVSVYAVAIELGSSRATATTFAALAVSVPPLSRFALEGLLDDLTLSMLAIAVLFLLRHARSERPGELAIAGLALGLALGTKWFGLTSAAVVVVVWIAVRVASRARAAAITREGGVLLGMMALGGGFWLVRNLIESGNPLYPKAVSLFGLKLFAGSHGDLIDRFGYSILDYVGKPHIVSAYIYPGFKIELGLAGLVLLVGVVVALACAIPRRRDTHWAPLLAVAIVTVGICATYAITPGTGYGPKNQPTQAYVTLRWLMPAVVMGAAACAAVAARSRVWGALLTLAALAGIIDAIHLGPPVSGTSVVEGVLILVAVTAALLAARRLCRRAVSVDYVPSAALILAALVAVLAVGRFDEHRFDSHSYASFDPAFAWIDANAPSGHRIGLTGSTGATPGLAPTLPLFGPRLGNRVSYVGDRVVHSVEVPTSERSFQRELRSGRYDLLAIGLPYAGRTDAWARKLRFPLLARSNRLALYQVPATAR
jgi:4-amino-4-deoxy-L-arabinose transferase-like glycosyltransferase